MRRPGEIRGEEMAVMTVEEWNDTGMRKGFDGDHTGALECFERGLELDPNSERCAANNVGVAHWATLVERGDLIGIQ